jgi:hypothetical protein
MLNICRNLAVGIGALLRAILFGAPGQGVLDTHCLHSNPARPRGFQPRARERSSSKAPRIRLPSLAREATGAPSLSAATDTISRGCKTTDVLPILKVGLKRGLGVAPTAAALDRDAEVSFLRPQAREPRQDAPPPNLVSGVLAAE